MPNAGSKLLVTDLTNWTSYTPTWTASGGGLVLGTSTREGTFIRVGNLVVANIRCTVASGFTAGSGFYKFGLPFTPSADFFIGAVYVNRASAGAEYTGICRFADSNTVAIDVPRQTGTTTNGTPIPASLVGAAFPAAPASGDQYVLTVVFPTS